MVTCSERPAFEVFGDTERMVAAGLMVKETGRVAVTLALSCTWTVKFAAVEVVGWPPIRPVAGVKVSPAGKDPTDIVQV
jgi:hypothetical protein